MKFVALAAIPLLALLVHLGAIAAVLSHPGLAAAAAVALLAITPWSVKRIGFRADDFPIRTRAVRLGAIAGLTSGALLVLAGFAMAHHCNADINRLGVCVDARAWDLVCHRLGPVLMLLGLGGLVAERHMRRASRPQRAHTSHHL